jgi:hypothetical protein
VAGCGECDDEPLGSGAMELYTASSSQVVSNSATARIVFVFHGHITLITKTTTTTIITTKMT